MPSPQDPPVDFPTREECVLPDMLAARALEAPDQTFAVFDDETWSHAAAATEAWRAAHALQRVGVEAGDYVSVWMPTGPDVLRAWFGANAAGAVYSPLNLAARGSYLQHTLNLAESKVLVADPGLVDRLAGLDLPHLEQVVLVGDPVDVSLPWPTVTFAEILDGVPDERPALSRPVEPWDDLSLIYTSGTTGPSKGVRASYAAFWNYGRCFIKRFVDESDRYLQPLPMFYTAGTGITYSMLQAGGSLAYPKGFSSKTFWDDIRRFDATITIAIHGMVSFLLDQPPRPDDADNPLRVVYMGPLTRHREFAGRFGCRVYTAYGMTEVPVPLVSGLDPEDGRSCGRNADPENYELRLVDEHDVPVPVGTPGELIVRNTRPWTINSGYKNMPEATANAWRNGWFHTGDEFLLDEEGNFFFLDRKKDVIRRRGVNISSYEVEEEVRSHPDVKDVAAVAVRNPDMEESAGDEEVKVVVVLEDGASLEPEALLEYLTPRMPRHWLPRFVELAPELPRTESFKVRKSDLRDAGVTAAMWDREKAATLTREAR